MCTLLTHLLFLWYVAVRARLNLLHNCIELDGVIPARVAERDGAAIG